MGCSRIREARQIAAEVMIASVSPGAVELRPWSDYGWWACRARDNPDPAAGSPEEGKKHTVTHAMPRDELTPTPRRLRATGVILMASVQYVICTIIAASAWKNPSYDWFNNYISDLGFRTCGVIAMRYACSPLHDLMNMSLIVQGIITVAAVIVGIRIVPRHRVGIAIAGVMTGIGIACVGFFPGSIEGGATGGFPIHGLSALVAVLAGDATLLLLGLAVWHRSRRAGILLIAVVALSFTSMLWVTFAPHAVFGPGLPERLAVDSFFVTCIAIGGYLFCASFQTSELESGSPQVH